MEKEHTAGHDHEARSGGHDHEQHTHEHQAREGHPYGPDCGCGDHAHEAHPHGPDCGCGDHAHEAHHHHHGPGCGCGDHEHGEGEDGPDYENGLSIAENNVLMALLDRGGLPVARFALTSSKDQEAYAVAMGPVYIADPEDSLEAIREYGALFSEMEHKGLIELDYDFPLPGYAYGEYRGSAAWRHFEETAAEAKGRGFTFDTPHLELGGITLTERGQEVIDEMIR